LDIAAASERLGVSPEALRKRIRRGTVTSEKQDGRWYICLDNDQDTGQDTSWTQQDTVQDTGRDALVEQLQSEVDFLRTELEARREAEREQRIIISQLVGRVEALQAGYDMPHAPESDDRPGNEGGDDDNTEIADEPEQIADIWETTTHQEVASWWAEVEARTEAPDSMENDDSTTAHTGTPPRRWWRFWEF
jgi:hypothetical protein